MQGGWWEVSLLEFILWDPTNLGLKENSSRVGNTGSVEGCKGWNYNLLWRRNMRIFLLIYDRSWKGRGGTRKGNGK